MADTYIKGVFRPTTQTRLLPDAPGAFTDGDRLIAEVDYNNDGARVATIVLPFADYAGLETEWEAGSATTVLEAAVATWIAANGFPTDHLSSTQRSAIDVALNE